MLIVVLAVEPNEYNEAENCCHRYGVIRNANHEIIALELIENAMQKLKLSTLVLLVGIATATTAIANPAEDMQTQAAMTVATIEKMYQQDASNQGQDYPVTLEQYGNQELQAAMQLEREYFDREQMSCHIGYDVLWDAQDPDYGQDKRISMTKQGLVKVSLAQGSDIYYKLSCDDSECSVADVIVDDDGTSLREYLIEACR